MKLKDGPTIRNWDKIKQMLLDERKKQINKWGVQEWDSHKWNSILVEEVGEFAESLLFLDNDDSTENLDHAIDEIKQIAMVAVNIMDCLIEYKKG